jgi:rhomboid protease GluP
VALLLVILVLGGVVLRAMTADERAQLLNRIATAIREGREISRKRALECEPLHETLRARTRYATATPALAAVSAFVFVSILTHPAARDAGLLAWGGSSAPRTTNGEWWRLITAVFINAGILQLMANVLGVYRMAPLLERLVGSLTFVAVFFASGVLSVLVNTAMLPLAPSYGPSGAIFGLYGLLLSSSIWTTLSRSNVTLPMAAVKRLAPPAAIFLLYNAAASELRGLAELTGLATGFVMGLALTRNVSERKPTHRQIAIGAAIAAVAAVALAIPIRGVTDVRGEIDRLAGIEQNTAGAYAENAAQFSKGKLPAEKLAAVIDESIVPELEDAGARLATFTNVPAEQQPLLATAQEYVHLRIESWKLRADGIRKINYQASGKMKREADESDVAWRRRSQTQYLSNARVLGKAEGAERAALQTLERIKSGD